LFNLAPNTTYYFRIFNYAGTAGNESYNTSEGITNNPSSSHTLTLAGSPYDDDLILGSNDTRATSVTIGANTPYRGTIKTATDVDWYNFTVTNAAPNIRVRLYGLPANYNVDLYDPSGVKIRRSVLSGTKDDSFLLNGLTPGTYTLKIYNVNGVYSATLPYYVRIDTRSGVLYSVTP
jgi:hypothetical protein